MSHFKGGMKRVFSKKEKCHCRVLMNNAATDEWKDVNSFQRPRVSRDKEAPSLFPPPNNKLLCCDVTDGVCIVMSSVAGGDSRGGESSQPGGGTHRVRGGVPDRGCQWTV